MKYGAAEATFGSKNAGDLPVDAHELIALCAPRLTFISYGVPEKGDAKWLDHQGSYMAAVAAQPVFRLLGAKDLGVSEDYRTAKMPPVNVGLLDGQLAWRQHDGGHTDAPELEVLSSRGPTGSSGRRISKRPGGRGRWRAPIANSELAHQQLLDKGQAGTHRHLLRRRLDHAALGRQRLSRTAGQLEPKLLWLERRRFRLGRATQLRTFCGG